MPEALSVQKLDALLATHRDLIDQAIKILHYASETPMSLEILELTEMGATVPRPLAEAIAAYLDGIAMTATFIGILRSLKQDVGEADTLPDMMQVDAASFDMEEMKAFCGKASAFRCRIVVNNQIAGSGVLISHRLVLTAWHVVNREIPWEEEPELVVIASNNVRYAAKLAGPYSDCHPDEWKKLVVPDDQLADHSDFVLLRLFEPVGYSLGHLAISDQPLVWNGEVACYLVHFPDGQDRGITQGKVAYGGGHRRYQHSVPTMPGSSGGAAFSNGFAFIGLHQGSVGDSKRLVPVANYMNDNAFRSTIGLDAAPKYLWSLDRSLNSHLIVGRRLFFEAVNAIIEGHKSINGVWIKRTQPEEAAAGQNFSLRLLEHFLALRDPGASVVRIDVPEDGSDLIDLVAARISAEGAATEARPGVRADETTAVAYERDRADALVSWMDQRDENLWLYVQSSSQELPRDVQLQLEQVIGRLERARRIKLVLSGLEGYHVPVATHQSLEAAEGMQMGLVVEYIEDFTRADLVDTVRVIDGDLELALTDADVEVLTDQVLLGVPTQFGRYSSKRIGEISEALATLLRPRTEAA